MGRLQLSLWFLPGFPYCLMVHRTEVGGGTKKAETCAWFREAATRITHVVMKPRRKTYLPSTYCVSGTPHNHSITDEKSILLCRVALNQKGGTQI